MDDLERSDVYPPGWSEEDVERLVGRVSQRVMENFYQEVGRGVLTKLFSWVGIAFVAFLIYVAGAKFKMWSSQ
jgi:hypothetical protein